MPRPSSTTLPPGDITGRVSRLEAGVAQLQREFDELKPSIQRLVAIEDDLDELVAQLFTVVAPPPPGASAPTAATAPPAPAATAPPPPPQAGAAPLSLLPSQATRPAAPVTPPTAQTAQQTAQAAPPPPAPAIAPAATPAAAANAFALHLASFRTRDKVAEGWADVAAKVPAALQGLRGGAAPFDKPGDGRYFRLNAGPVASRADAEARCRAIQNAGLYCAVLPYSGTAPL